MPRGGRLAPRAGRWRGPIFICPSTATCQSSQSETGRRLLQSLIPLDTATDRAELLDLHLVVMRISCLILSDFLNLRPCPVDIFDGRGKPLPCWKYLLTQYHDLDIDYRDWEGSTALRNAVAFCSLDWKGLIVLRYVAILGNLNLIMLFVCLVETGVVSVFSLDPAIVSHANVTLLQNLDTRLDVSKHTRSDIPVRPSPDMDHDIGLERKRWRA